MSTTKSMEKNPVQEAGLQDVERDSYIWPAISTPYEPSQLTPKHNIPKRGELPKDWDGYPDGYAQYAAFIASDPDKSTTIYRRYERLSARNLLYLESEVAELEQQLDVLDSNTSDIVDDPTRTEATQGAQDWTHLREQFLSDKPAVQARAKLHIELVMRIREKLKEYHEALSLTRDIFSFQSPQKYPLRGTRNTFWKEEAGESMILDALQEHLNTRYEQDLCVLNDAEPPDTLTKFFEEQLASFFRPRKGNDVSTQIISHKKVEFWAASTSVGLSAVVLIVAVVVLYFVHSPPWRLAVVCVFTAVFNIALGILTRARRQEVFAATAAYAAVLVVFVSGDLGSSSAQNETPVQIASAVAPALAAAIATAVTATTSTTTFPAANLQTSSPVDYSSNSSALNGGAIAGIVIGVVALLIAANLMIWLYIVKRAKSLRRSQDG